MPSFSHGKSSTGLATLHPLGFSVSWQEKRSTKTKMGKSRVMVLNELVTKQRIPNSKRYTTSLEIWIGSSEISFGKWESFKQLLTMDGQLSTIIRQQPPFLTSNRRKADNQPLYFIGLKGSEVKNNASIFSTIFPETSDASRTLIHSGSATNRPNAALNSSLDWCPIR